MGKIQENRGLSKEHIRSRTCEMNTYILEWVYRTSKRVQVRLGVVG